MLRRTCISRKGFENWPWPSKLPLKPHWFKHYSSSPNGSISREVRGIQFIGDIAVVATLGLIAYNVYQNWKSGNFKTRLRHTTGLPPAIIAQEFDFQNLENNRKVSRARLDEYRDDFARRRTIGQTIESWIFKY